MISVETEHTSDLDKMKNRLGSVKEDRLGRPYQFSTGKVPQDIEYENYEELRNMSLDIARKTDRGILEELILAKKIVFMKSVKGRKLNGKPMYITGLRTSVRCATGVTWSYLIEATSDFEILSKQDQYAILLKYLMRVPDKEIPSGQLVSFNSYDHYQRDLRILFEN